MNKVILLGRTTRDIEIRYSQSAEPMAVGKFALAVNRQFKKDGKQEVDFINCTVFGKKAESLEKWVKKGQQIAVEGRIQTGSYTNKEGQKVYTTDVMVDNWEFAEGKKIENSREGGIEGFTEMNDEPADLPF